MSRSTIQIEAEEDAKFAALSALAEDYAKKEPELMVPHFHLLIVWETLKRARQENEKLRGEIAKLKEPTSV